ncbi:glycosyltransferase [Oceanobacillus luteolus]|nr:glycosyltransferase [Oceanobacillus luteolus]
MFVIGVLSNGGAERVISVLANSFIRMGYEVDIITIYGSKNDYINDDRIHIHPLSIGPNNKLSRFIQIIYQMRKIIKKRRPNILISFVAIINIYTIIANLFNNTKLIVSERNDPYQNPENKYIRKLRDFLYVFCDGYVFQTPDAMKYFPLNIQKKGVIIPNPIKEGLPRWNNENTEKTIITACRLVKQKNIPMLLNAFAKLKKEFPDYKLKIFGIGELHKQIQKNINELGLTKDVILPGFSNNIHEEMVKSSLFVISSNYEGISNSMLEALAIGIPVVSTDSPIGGARMFIRHEQNGMLTEVGNTEEFYEAMKKVISDKKLANELSLNSREIREILSSEVISNKWLEYIQKIWRGDYEEKLS